MTCRRIARELLEFFRFGDLDFRSTPHLAHLETCSTCRETVGLDRELVVQLQRALRDRVAGHEPSAAVWPEIRRRVLEPEPQGRFNRLGWALRLMPVGAAFAVLAFVAVPGLMPSPTQDLAPVAVGTGLMATADHDPTPIHADAWYLAYTTPLPPSPPATQLTAWVDPSGKVPFASVASTGPIQ